MTQANRKPKRKPKTAMKLLEAHTPHCSQGWKFRQYILDSVDFLRRDKTFRRNPRTNNQFLIFRCNDSSCRARLAVYEKYVEIAIGIPQRERPGPR
jgi:hypothetical protein